MEAVVPIAGQLVSELGPYLPYLVAAGESVGARAAEELQEEGGELARNLWQHIGPKIESRPSAHEAAHDLASNPADVDAQAALRMQVRKLLLDDPQLRRQLEDVLRQAQGSVSTVNVQGSRSVGVGGNIEGSTIVTGDESGPRHASRE